ncbi:hypothetical protein BJF91_09675 [Allorhizobium taibaishanense]|uniref:Uncharacterized protein n=2 Tax=Allorhizobium taibaishanense TaxID=887144 RepID=A0A1Q9AAW4_9HYPH|nr:hypothetical protein BJF91_09675 [Allorhizobium taibaishanense]
MESRFLQDDNAKTESRSGSPRTQPPLQYSYNSEEITMAKGQVRGNKEVRKPKKDKTAEKSAPVALGSQVKNSESTTKKK